MLIAGGMLSRSYQTKSCGISFKYIHHLHCNHQEREQGRSACWPRSRPRLMTCSVDFQTTSIHLSLFDCCGISFEYISIIFIVINKRGDILIIRGNRIWSPGGLTSGGDVTLCRSWNYIYPFVSFVLVLEVEFTLIFLQYSFIHFFPLFLF